MNTDHLEDSASKMNRDDIELPTPVKRNMSVKNPKNKAEDVIEAVTNDFF